MKIKKTLAKSEICVYNVNINHKGIKTAVEKIQKESPLSGQEGGITMEIKVLGKELKVTEAINDYVEKKLERIDKYFETASAEVTIRAEKNEQIAEVTVSANGESYRAEAEEKDLYASIDKVIDILKDPGPLLEMNGAPWNKIYKANLLKEQADLEHPPRILDDMMFLLLIYINAKKVVFVNESLVFYMVRQGSIITSIKKEQVESTYQAMIEVRKVYENSENRVRMLPLLDAMAFLHLGVSLMFRLSYDKNCKLKEAVKENSEFLDNYFPTWRYTKFVKLGYVIKNHVNFKLWIIKIVYKLHLFRAFLSIYRFMIDKLHIDIKW